MPNFSLEVVDFWLERQKNKTKTNSMKLMASLAPAQAEVESGVVGKADQNMGYFFIALTCNSVMIFLSMVLERNSMGSSFILRYN